MKNTYKNAADASADQAQQQALLGALNAWDRALRRDECGAWRINGNHGHIYTWGDGKTWLIYAAPGTIRSWSAAKARLSFCKITQNGDDEGCLRLFEPPNADQATIIRDILGIRKRVEYSPEVLEGYRARGKRWAQAQKQAGKPSGVAQ